MDYKIGTHVDELEDWLRSFAEQHQKQANQVSYKKHSAKLLDQFYGNTINKKIKPLLVDNACKNVDRHKIVSTFELCIMGFLPIKHEKRSVRLDLNAQLAMFIAKTIIVSWHSPADFRKEVLECPTFDREHLTWLKIASIEHFPIFSNSAVWFLYEELILERNKKKVGLRQFSTPV